MEMLPLFSHTPTLHTYFCHEIVIDRKPLFLFGSAFMNVPRVHDVGMQDEPIVFPFGEKVTRDFHRVLDVVDLAHVKTIETYL